MNYAAFYTSLTRKGFIQGRNPNECIKSAPFIHMFARKNIVFMSKICYISLAVLYILQRVGMTKSNLSPMPWDMRLLLFSRRICYSLPAVYIRHNPLIYRPSRPPNSRWLFTLSFTSLKLCDIFHI